jgi:hypothetical protein
VVPPGGAVDVALELDVDADARALAGDPLVPGVTPAAARSTVEALLLHAELDAVVLVAATWRGEVATLIGQWCGGAPPRCSAIVEVDLPSADPAGLAAALPALWRGLRDARAEARLAPTLLSDRRISSGGAGRGITHRCRWCRKRWIWIAAGAAVVVGGVATWALASGGPGDPVVIVDTGDWGSP